MNFVRSKNTAKIFKDSERNNLPILWFQII